MPRKNQALESLGQQLLPGSGHSSHAVPSLNLSDHKLPCLQPPLCPSSTPLEGTHTSEVHCC